MPEQARPWHWATVIKRWATDRQFEQKDFYVELLIGACTDLYKPKAGKDEPEAPRTGAIRYIRSVVFELDCERVGINPDFLRGEIADHGPNITMGDLT